MYKLNSLRDHLMQHVPGLRDNPDRLHVFVDEQGSITCAADASGTISGWQYRYEAKALVTDFAQHPDSFIAPILEWVLVEQPELLLSYSASEEGIRFDSDIISDTSIDLQVTLKLTERVTMRVENGARVITHHTEPQLNPQHEVQHWQIIQRHPDGTPEDVVLDWTVTPNMPEPQP